MATEQTRNIEQIPVPSKTESAGDFKKESSLEVKIEQASTQTETEKKSTAPIINTPVNNVVTKNDLIIDDYHQKRGLALDGILSEGLEETFLAMSAEKQKNFKEEGEVTVKKINILLDAAKINISKIATLIRKWLSIIPGINHFFLDQEAKIKTDKIIKIKNKF